jgi:DNA topoisomerase-1
VQVLNGRWGPYLVIEKNNYKIPKGTDAASLTLQDCLDIAADPKNASKGNRFRKKEAVKPAKEPAKKEKKPKTETQKTAPKKAAKKTVKKAAAKKVSKKTVTKTNKTK